MTSVTVTGLALVLEPDSTSERALLSIVPLYS